MRILLIDDDEDLRSLLSRYIRGQWPEAEIEASRQRLRVPTQLTPTPRTALSLVFLEPRILLLAADDRKTWQPVAARQAFSIAASAFAAIWPPMMQKPAAKIAPGAYGIEWPE